MFKTDDLPLLFYVMTVRLQWAPIIMLSYDFIQLIHLYCIV